MIVFLIKKVVLVGGGQAFLTAARGSSPTVKEGWHQLARRGLSPLFLC